MLKESYEKKDVASFQKDAPKTGSIEVRLANPKKTGTLTVREYWREFPDGQREFRPFVDSNGNPRISKYSKKKVLNMVNENDRLEYNHLLYHPYVTGVNPTLKLVNFEDEAQAYVVLKDSEAKANEKISQLSGEKLEDLARVLQVRVRPGSSETVLKRALYEFAARPKDKDNNVPGAARILNEMESPDYTRRILLRKAMDKSIVKTSTGRYTFGQVNMSGSFDGTISWLRDNPEMESELNKLVNVKTEE